MLVGDFYGFGQKREWNSGGLFTQHLFIFLPRRSIELFESLHSILYLRLSYRLGRETTT